MKDETNQFLTIAEASKFLSISEGHLRRMVKAGQFQAININFNKDSDRKILRILKSDLMNITKIQVANKEEVNQ